MHLLATIVGALICMLGLVKGQTLWLPAGLLVAYAISIPSHLLIEGNWPTAARHPIWSALADIQMCALLVTGRMGAEMRRLQIPTAEPRRRSRVQPAC
jgi:hypothetical protein